MENIISSIVSVDRQMHADATHCRADAVFQATTQMKYSVMNTGANRFWLQPNHSRRGQGQSHAGNVTVSSLSSYMTTYTHKGAHSFLKRYIN